MRQPCLAVTVSRRDCGIKSGLNHYDGMIESALYEVSVLSWTEIPRSSLGGSRLLSAIDDYLLTADDVDTFR